MSQILDVVVMGAGAAGLMCAMTAGARGRRVLVLDHANKAGKKILMSGGGRCNFTHLHSTPENFTSDNPHFCISALNRYTPWHFLELVDRHGIAHFEKTPGQLFCVESSKQIVEMLLRECERVRAEVRLETKVEGCKRKDNRFTLQTSTGVIEAESLVVATGGLSIPTLGASPFGYQLAEQFGLSVLPTRAGLVPFTLHPEDKQWLAPLSGVSADVRAEAGGRAYAEPMLITHRGLSGPAMLQVSSWWQPGEAVHINLLPQQPDLLAALRDGKKGSPQSSAQQWLEQYLPKRLASALCQHHRWQGPLQHYADEQLVRVANDLCDWQVKPAGTEGYRTAEVTLGGVDTRHLSSKTMMVKDVPGLYFIGEVVDVTGELGGHNFQWAWASGHAAGEVV
jgi:predicted Rossmann fold flavoprotein